MMMMKSLVNQPGSLHKLDFKQILVNKMLSQAFDYLEVKKKHFLARNLFMKSNN